MKFRENSDKFTTSKTDKSWIDYRALTKTGLSANIDRPCNTFKQNSADQNQTAPEQSDQGLQY